jgi:hypothetical protein
MLTTFSLMSTAVNARSTSTKFAALLEDARATPELKEAMKSAEYFLCGSQQSPIRIHEGRFQELFNQDPQRLRDRWLPLEERLRSTRRQYTFSLFAQTFFAFVAWVLTIIGSYVTSLGQHSEALLLSSGTLWTWLIPIVLGWMAVGVQSREDTVKYAIRGEIIGGKSAPLKALEARSGFEDPLTKVEDAFWGTVQGDEACQGPVYNYARMLTYPYLRDRIIREFEAKLASLHAQEPQVHHTAFVQEPEPLPSTPENHNLGPALGPDSASSESQTASAGSQEPNRKSTTATEAGITPDVERPYMEWKYFEASSDWKRNFMTSNAIAVFLQWGVTGSAITISYLTEVRGLGCRSGSYLLYGVLATSTHVLLLGSVFLSHHVMLVYQKEHKQIKWIGRLAVLLRVFGKSVAITNAFWIILSSVFELIGFYESCWCTGTVLGLGNRAWVVLFVSGDKMREDAEASWIGGLAMSLITMFITYLISRVYSSGRKN